MVWVVASLLATGALLILLFRDHIERRFDAAGDDKRIADEDYIRQSITQPHSQLVYPYGKNMTIYDPMLPEPQIIGMIEYIKSLADVPRDADAW